MSEFGVYKGNWLKNDLSECDSEDFSVGGNALVTPQNSVFSVVIEDIAWNN